MQTIITNDHGINWMFYTIYRIDYINKTIQEIHSWRAHKFEDRGYHPRNTIPARKATTGCNIKQWKDDGKPGGIDGLRANYRYKPFVSINKQQYELIKHTN